MELFSLIAKLALDARDYERGLSQAKSDAKIELQDPKLGIDTTEFDQGISDAEGTEVSDPDDPSLGLDVSDFDSAVEDAENTEVDDPDDPELGLDIEDYKDNIDEAETLGDGFGESMSSVFDSIKSAITAAGITGTLVAIISFLKQGISLAKDNGDTIDKQSQKLKLTTAAYQELDYALTLSGSSITDLTRAMRTFTEISGGKITDDQAEAFEKLGISATDASGEMKSAQELMEESLYALADYKGSDRGILQEALFGRNSASLNALLNAGSEGIKEMRQEANDLGLVMTDEEIKNAASYMDATTRLEKSLEGLQTSLVSDIIPLLTEAANKVATIIAFFNGRTNNSLSDQFKETDEQLASNLLSIEGTSSAAATLVDKLYAMGDAEKMTAEQQEEWKATADWLITNIPSLNDVIDKDTLSITANKDEINKMIETWRTYAIEQAKLNALKEKQDALAKKTTEWLKKEYDATDKENELLAKEREYRASIQKDYESMPEDVKKRMLQGSKFTLEDADFSANTDFYKWVAYRLENSDQGYGYYYSKNSMQLGSDIIKLSTEAKELQEDAADLKDEVEKGQDEITKYSAGLDEVISGLITDTSDATEEVKGLQKELDNLPDEKTVQVVVTGNGMTLMPQAKGDWIVPYDNYPSLLHRDEMVLTASEARRYRDGGAGDNMTGLEDRIISAIREGLDNATVRSYINGREITDEVNRELTAQAAAGRYR